MSIQDCQNTYPGYALASSFKRRPGPEIVERRSYDNILSIAIRTHINKSLEFQNLKFKIPCDMNFELGGQDSLECKTKKEGDLLKKDLQQSFQGNNMPKRSLST